MKFVDYSIVVVTKEKNNTVIQKIKDIVTVIGGHKSFHVFEELPENTDEIHICIFLGLDRKQLERELQKVVCKDSRQALIAIGDCFYSGDVNAQEEEEKSPIKSFNLLDIEIGEKYFKNVGGFGHQTNNFLNLFHHK